MATLAARTGGSARQAGLPAAVRRPNLLPLGRHLQHRPLVVLVFRLTGSGLGMTGAVITEIAPGCCWPGGRCGRRPAPPGPGHDRRRPVAHGPGRPPAAGQPAAGRRLCGGIRAGRRRGVLQPSRQLGAASIVDEDELVAANSGLWSAAVISQIALAPLVGALVATVGVGPRSWSTRPASPPSHCCSCPRRPRPGQYHSAAHRPLPLLRSVAAHPALLPTQPG
jgi:hypothetical protein